MDELILDEIAEEEEELESSDDLILATVASVGNNGVTIIIDGDDEAGEKQYKVNAMQRLVAGDRVKICRTSGTYVIEYVIGKPMARYPIPAGGSNGQVLVKDGSPDYSVRWTTLSMHGIPAGGSSGQVLAKSSATDYAVAWSDVPHELPTGGTDGQVLTKNGSTNYSVKWADPASGTPTKIQNGNYGLQIDNSGNLYQVNTSYAVHLGTARYPISNCYISGNCFLACSTSSNLGFFGTTKSARIQTVASNASVATLITALKAYNLIQ